MELPAQPSAGKPLHSRCREWRRARRLRPHGFSTRTRSGAPARTHRTSRFGLKRNRIGGSLLAATARTVAARESGLYLWVVEQNASAQAFYEAASKLPCGVSLRRA